MKKYFWWFCVLSFLVLVPNLLIPIINYGQLGKEVFVAEMTKSFFNGETEKGILFPIRHFLETSHNHLVPWAEEFPIYHFMILGLMRLFTAFGLPASIIYIGKALNILGFSLLIFGFFRIGKKINANQTPSTPWIFATTAVLFPAFRLYTTEVMPDLWMTTCCVWAIELALSEKPFQSAFMIMAASLFKYYAAFTGFGLGLFYLNRWIKKRNHQDFWKAGSFVLAILPCILFIAYFIHLHIPNPIVEYRETDGHGHFSSFSGLFNYSKWAKAGLWIFVKNGTILGTALAAYGLWIHRKKTPSIIWFLLFGWAMFPLTFLESFMIHDYYGLQSSIGIALFMAIGLNELSNRKFFIPLVTLFLIFSAIHVRGMSKPNRDFDQIMSDYPQLVSKLSEKPKWGFVISAIGKNMIPYITELNSWMAGFHELETPSTRSRMLDPRIDLVMIHNFKNYAEDTKTAEKIVMETGLYEPVTQKEYDDSVLLVFKRK